MVGGRTKPARWDGIVRRLASLRLFVQHVAGAQGGKRFGPDGIGHFTGQPAEQNICRAAGGRTAAARVRQLSERLTGMPFPAPDGRERLNG